MAEKDKQSELADAVAKIKSLVTSEGDDGSQLDAGDSIKDLLSYLSETFPGAFEPKPDPGEKTQAERLFGQ